jgi:hypothetical protein
MRANWQATKPEAGLTLRRCPACNTETHSIGRPRASAPKETASTAAIGTRPKIGAQQQFRSSQGCNRQAELAGERCPSWHALACKIGMQKTVARPE